MNGEIRTIHNDVGNAEFNNFIGQLLHCIAFLVLILGIIFGISSHAESNNNRPYFTSFNKAAIVSNGKECAAIGNNIFRHGGSIADAAIATLLCEGVVCFQSMGIGGGFLMVYYNRKTQIIRVLNARESAPSNAFTNMFKQNTSLASKGGLSVAVPGEIRGYELLWKTYGGHISWENLFKPSIKLCREGFVVTNYTAYLLKTREQAILKEPSLREIFINPKTNRTWNAGDKMTRPKLGDTLEIISKQGANALYEGALAEAFVEDIKNFHGIVELSDLRSYKAYWDEPVVTDLKENRKVYSPPLPGSGILLKLILNILDNGFLPEQLNSGITWHRIVEALKFSYGMRTNLGDPKFESNVLKLISNMNTKEFADTIRKQINDNFTNNNPEYYGAKYYPVNNYGTAHICLIAPNGDAISVTSTINLLFGAFIRSPSTGIILNNEMDDFSSPYILNSYGIPPSPANFIKPGKRPLSSMCPCIILDKENNVQLVIGAAGGTKIISSVALVIIRHLLYNQHIVDAVAAERLHHQLFPMKIIMESGFQTEILESLRKKNHTISIRNPGDGFTSVTAIARMENKWIPFSDVRRNGSVAGIN